MTSSSPIKSIGWFFLILIGLFVLDVPLFWLVHNHVEPGWLIDLIFPLGYGMVWLIGLACLAIFLHLLTWLWSSRRPSSEHSWPLIGPSALQLWQEIDRWLNYWRRRVSWASLCVTSTLFVVFALKALVGRPRPVWGELYGLYWPQWWEPNVDSLASFPSGHAATYMVLASILGLPLGKGRWWIWVVGSLCGLMRVWQGGHYVSDVFVGLVIAVVVPLGVSIWLDRRGWLLCIDNAQASLLDRRVSFLS